MQDNELLIFGLLFLAIVGFNVFKQFLAARAQQQRRQQQASVAQQAPQAEPDAQPFVLTESDWGRAPEPAAPRELPLEVQRKIKPEAAKPAPRAARDTTRPIMQAVRRRPRHRLFQSRRALRDGIVMMTVLGPCRALKPYDENHS